MKRLPIYLRTGLLLAGIAGAAGCDAIIRHIDPTTYNREQSDLRERARQQAQLEREGEQLRIKARNQELADEEAKWRLTPAGMADTICGLREELAELRKRLNHEKKVEAEGGVMDMEARRSLGSQIVYKKEELHDAEQEFKAKTGKEFSLAFTCKK